MKSNTRLESNIFFIIGRPRSGTSLLRVLFDAHPNVNIPFECPFILDLSKKYAKNNQWTKDLINEFIEDLRNIRKFPLLQINEEKLRHDLYACTGENSYENIIKTVSLNFTSVFNKKEVRLIGDKNPIYSLRLKYIFRLFPNAKFIIIFRDYRNHAISMMKHKFGKSNPGLIAFRWKIFVNNALQLKANYPDNLLILKYEEFVNQPEEKFENICDFLHINFEPSVFDFYKFKDKFYQRFSKEVVDKHHKDLFNPIVPQKEEKWKSEMTDKQIKVMDRMVGKYAEKAGYERKFTSISLKYRFLNLFYSIRFTFNQIFRNQ